MDFLKKVYQTATKSLFALFGLYPANRRKYQRMVDFEKKWSLWIVKKKLSLPPPSEAKHLVMERYNIPNAVWLETGTFRGDTTRFLASISPRVISIEPSVFYFQEASKTLAGFHNVELFQGSSEQLFEKLLKSLSGQDVCFWLDGHWSGEATWCGKNETPILAELATIEFLKDTLAGAAVLIDDYRCCWSSPEVYPKPSFYISWAERNHLNWFIEQDIFIATSAPLPLRLE